MIYLDYGATSFHKPHSVGLAMASAMAKCANPGRGGYGAAMRAQETVYRCRERAAQLFGCLPEQVVFTSNCTHGLNIAIATLVKPGSRVVVSGFEHNAVVRPLYGLDAKVTVAGRRLFDWTNTLEEFEDALRAGVDAAVFTHVSNVFGYILPVEQMAQLCKQYGVPFILDAAQSAGVLPVNLEKLGAAFIAMPGHKGLLGPQGTGLLLCDCEPKPLLLGGTGSHSIDRNMPVDLPDRLEAGTMNVPGIAGLGAGIHYLQTVGIDTIYQREHAQLKRSIHGMQKMGLQVFTGEHQGGTVSFVPKTECEVVAQKLADMGIAVRAGLHCAPVAHESAGTLQTGTVRISFGWDASPAQTHTLLRGLEAMKL